MSALDNFGFCTRPANCRSCPGFISRAETRAADHNRLGRSSGALGSDSGHQDSDFQPHCTSNLQDAHFTICGHGVRGLRRAVRVPALEIRPERPPEAEAGAAFVDPVGRLASLLALLPACRNCWMVFSLATASLVGASLSQLLARPARHRLFSQLPALLARVGVFCRNC